MTNSDKEPDLGVNGYFNSYQVYCLEFDPEKWEICNIEKSTGQIILTAKKNTTSKEKSEKWDKHTQVYTKDMFIETENIKKENKRLKEIEHKIIKKIHECDEEFNALCMKWGHSGSSEHSNVLDKKILLKELLTTKEGKSHHD